MSGTAWASLRQAFRLADERRPASSEAFACPYDGSREKGKAGTMKLAALNIAARATIRGTGILQ